MPNPDEMMPEDREALRQRMRAMPQSGAERYRAILESRGGRRPVRPQAPPPDPDQASPPQDLRGPTYGEQMSHQNAIQAAEIQAKEEPVKKTVTKRADGTTVETIDLGTGKVTETKKGGEVISQKVVQNDMTDVPTTPPTGRKAKGFGSFNALDAYGGGLPMPMTGGKVRPEDLAAYNPQRVEGLSDVKVNSMLELKRRLGVGGPQEAPKKPMRFVPPERTLSNMDWTPTKKLIDFIYGSNLAQGSTDPLEGEYKRALQKFEADVKAGNLNAKQQKSVAKEYNQWADLMKKTSEDPNQQMDWRLNQITGAGKLNKMFMDDKKHKANEKYRAAYLNYLKNKPASSSGAILLDLNRQLKEQQIAKNQKIIDKAETKTPAQLKSQATAESLSLDAAQARAAMDEGYDPTSYNILDMRGAPNLMKSDAAIRYHSASNSWTMERTRDVSGAAIKDNEMPAELRRFWPQPGEPESVVKDKEARRRRQEVIYWTKGWGSNTKDNPNAISTDEQRKQMMDAYDRANKPAISKKKASSKEIDKIDKRLEEIRKRKEELRK